MRIAKRKLLMYVCVSALIVSVGAQRVRVIDNKGTLNEIDPSKWEQKVNDIYNKNTGNVGIGTDGIITPAAKLHNAGSTILGSVAIGDFASNPTLDATETVDKYSGAVVTETSTTGISFSLPNPTNTTPGRIFQVSNSSTSTQTFTVGGVTLAPGSSTLFRWDGGAWSTISAASAIIAANDWHLTGNSGTTPGTGAGQNFIGTTDIKDFVFGTQGSEKMRLFSLNSISALGLGESDLSGISGGASTWSGPTLFLGTAGNIASKTGFDIIIDADNNATNSAFRIRTNGDVAPDALDLVTVEESGNVGIGVNPAYKLHVAGDVNFTGALRVAGSSGTSGQILQSTGAGAPSWVTPNYLSNITGLLSGGTNISVLGSGTTVSPYVINNTYSYTLPVATAASLGGVKIGTGINVTADGTISAANSGTVTSVSLSMPSIFSVSGSPVTSSGTLSATLNTQPANTIFAGPSIGAAASPTFRNLVLADLPTAIPNANLANSSITINGNSVSLGSSTTVTANTPNSITFNNGGVGAVSGTTFDGSAAQTISYNTIGAQASLNGAGYVKQSGTTTSYVSAIPNADLVNSTISGVSLGSNLYSLTAGVGLSGTAYNGSAAQTWTLSPASATTIGGVKIGSGINVAPDGTISAANSGSGWLLTGNSGTNAANNFVGTTDGQDLVFKINNTESGRLGFASHSTSFGYLSSASGADAVAIGSSANATSLEGIAIGKGTIAQIKNRTIAIGSGTKSLAEDGVAIGTNAKVDASIQSIAIGTNATSTSQYGIAIGAESTALTEFQSIAVGYRSNALSRDGIAIGTSAKATTENQAMAIGLEAEATSLQSIAIGALTKATTNDEATAVGYNTLASGWRSTALGSKANATATNATAIGTGAVADHDNTVILGNSANVGIGLSNPLYKLDVAGDVNLTGALRINGNNGSNGQILQSNGSVASWVNPSSVTVTGDVTGTLGATSVAKIQNIPVKSGTPSNGQILTYNSSTTQWEPATNSGSGWSLTGNAGTTAGTNFLGTTDDKDLVFKVNNTESGRLGVYTTSTSFGLSSTSGSSGTAVGKSASAGQNGVALGTSSSTGYQSTAVGYTAAAAGQSSVALGDQASASTYQSIAIGSSAKAQTLDQTIAIGVSATASGYQSAAIGNGASASAQNSTALGNGAIANAANTVILGNGANVGIGTSTPGNKLEVSSTSDPLKLGGLQTTTTPSYLLGVDASGVVKTVSASGSNIYTADGTIGGSRTVTMNANPITWNSTGATGNIFAIAGNSLTSGNLLNLSSSSATTGSLLNISSSSAAAVTNGLVNFNFSGTHTGNGFNVSDATVSGNALNINATALTSGNGLLVTGGSLLTSGSLIEATGAVSNSTTAGLLNIVNTAASSTGKIATIQANSTVGSGVTVLANGNVGIGTSTPAIDKRLDVNGTVNATNYTSPVQTLSSGVISWDLNNGANAKVTLTSNSTLNMSNVKAGMYGLIILTQDATGNRTLTFGSGTNKVINGGGGTITLTSTAGASDILSFFYDGTTYWWTIGNNYN